MDIQYRPYVISDGDSLTAMLDEAFGVDYFNLQDLNVSNHIGATFQGKPVGMVYFINHSDAIEIKTIVVQKEARHLRIGSLLLLQLMTLPTLTHRRFWTPLWVDKGVIPAASLFERAGFKRGHTMNDYWRLDSIQRQYSCPTCGHPCRCSAVIFMNP